MSEKTKQIFNLVVIVYVIALTAGFYIITTRLRHALTQQETANAAVQSDLASARAELATLKSQLQLSDQGQQACGRTLTKLLTDTLSARTVLVDRNHPDYQASVSLLGKRIPLGNPGPVWMIPSRVTPVLANDAPGAMYGYLGTDGQLLDGWHLATKKQ